MTWSPIFPRKHLSRHDAIRVTINQASNKARVLFITIRPSEIAGSLDWWSAGTRVLANVGSDEHAGLVQIKPDPNGNFRLAPVRLGKIDAMRQAPGGATLLLPGWDCRDREANSASLTDYRVTDDGLVLRLPEWLQRDGFAAPAPVPTSAPVEEPEPEAFTEPRWVDPPRSTLADAVAAQIAPVESRKLVPAPAPTSAPPKPAGAMADLWSEERKLLMESDYPRGVPLGDMLRAVNRLPGPPIDEAEFGAQVVAMGLRRAKPGAGQAPAKKTGPVRADRETIIRWGAERGLSGDQFDLPATNRKRASLGLPPFELDAPMRNRAGA